MKTKAIKQNTEKSDTEKLINEVRNLKLEFRASTKSLKELSNTVEKLSKKCAAINTDSSGTVIRTHNQLTKGKLKELNRKHAAISTDSSGAMISTDSSGAINANLNQSSGARNANHSQISKRKHNELE